MGEAELTEVADEAWLWRAVIRQALADATATATNKSGTMVEERDEARRWLLSPLHRQDRELVSTLAGYTAEQLEKHARAALAPILLREVEAEGQHIESEQEREERLDLLRRIEARERKAGRIAKPAPMWNAAEFLAYVVANESGLRELGELDAAIEEAAQRELAEGASLPRRERVTMPPRGRAAYKRAWRARKKAERYSQADIVPAIAAE